MKYAIVSIALFLSPFGAFAADAPPAPDPLITLKVSELTAIINEAVAHAAAAPALTKLQSQMAPPAGLNPKNTSPETPAK